MALCPICSTPGAYIGFNSVECRNPECKHFTVRQEKVCPCCGLPGHTPEYEDTNGSDAAAPADAGADVGASEEPQDS